MSMLFEESASVIDVTIIELLYVYVSAQVCSVELWMVQTIQENICTWLAAPNEMGRTTSHVTNDR